MLLFYVTSAKIQIARLIKNENYIIFFGREEYKGKERKESGRSCLCVRTRTQACAVCLSGQSDCRAHLRTYGRHLSIGTSRAVDVDGPIKVHWLAGTDRKGKRETCLSLMCGAENSLVHWIAVVEVIVDVHLTHNFI